MICCIYFFSIFHFVVALNTVMYSVQIFYWLHNQELNVFSLFRSKIVSLNVPLSKDIILPFLNDVSCHGMPCFHGN